MSNSSPAFAAASAAWFGSFALALAGLLGLVGGCSSGDAGEDVAAGDQAVTAAPIASEGARECRATTIAEVEACAACCGETHPNVLEIIATTERCNGECAQTGGIACYAPCQEAAQSACAATGGACESYFACVDACTRVAP